MYVLWCILGCAENANYSFCVPKGHMVCCCGKWWLLVTSLILDRLTRKFYSLWLMVIAFQSLIAAQRDCRCTDVISNWYHLLYRYHLMLQCWRKCASERPHFEEVCHTLTEILEDIQRESYFESGSDEETDNFNRQGSKKSPSGQSSFKSGW